MPRERLGWAIVGWLNFIALLLIGVIVASLLGFEFTISGWWIAGGVVATAVVIVFLWRVMARQKS